MNVSATDGILAGKVAIVTGAAGNIGEAYARTLADAGADVVAADVDQARVEAVVGRLNESGRRIVAMPVDIASEASVGELAHGVVEAFGGIDILVNNAALMMQIPRVPLAEFPIDWWERVLRVNVTGALLCSQACIPSMIERGGGRIVNQSSAGAFYNWTPYGVSKLAIVGLTYGLARQLGAHGITVNAIAPGTVRTSANQAAIPAESPYWEQAVKQTASGRTGAPEDLCGALLFVVSPANQWFSGQCLNVDGGWIMRV